MNFELTEEQRLIQDTARRFAAEQIAPTLEEEERKHEFRAGRVAQMGSLGFFSCGLPEELGGSGMGFMESALMAEQIARVSASWRLPFNMQNLGPALTVAKFGSEAQRRKYVPGWVAGTQLGFFAMTEPNTGSDVASMKTHAVDRGDHWEVHGNKMWISQAHVGDAGLLYAYTDRAAGNKGMTAFIIEPKQMKGCSARAIETKLGLHCAPTGEFVFDGMQVPKENVLGKPGDGFRICMWQLNQTRLGCASGALGVAGGALDLAIAYAQRAHPVRQADRPAPDDPGADRRDGGRAPGRADARLPRGLAQGPGQAQPVRNLGRQARRLGGRGARGQRMHEDLRLVWLLDRVPGRALLPRCEVAAGRRGHVQHPEDHHLGHGLRRHAQPRMNRRAIR
jgi:alkylation response protein AidB-like acyl-CoA dehydrogenase